MANIYHPGTIIESKLAKSTNFTVSDNLKISADYKYFADIMWNFKPKISSFNEVVYIEAGGASGTLNGRLKGLKGIIKSNHPLISTVTIKVIN